MSLNVLNRNGIAVFGGGKSGSSGQSELRSIYSRVTQASVLVFVVAYR